MAERVIDVPRQNESAAFIDRRRPGHARLVARKALPAHTFVAAYPGWVYHKSAFAAMVATGVRSTKYTVDMFGMRPDGDMEFSWVVDPTNGVNRVAPQFKTALAPFANEPSPGAVANMRWVWNLVDGTVEYWTSRAVKAGEELLICYGTQYQRNYGVGCARDNKDMFIVRPDQAQPQVWSDSMRHHMRRLADPKTVWLRFEWTITVPAQWDKHRSPDWPTNNRSKAKWLKNKSDDRFHENDGAFYVPAVRTEALRDVFVRALKKLATFRPAARCRWICPSTRPCLNLMQLARRAEVPVRVPVTFKSGDVLIMREVNDNPECDYSRDKPDSASAWNRIVQASSGSNSNTNRSKPAPKPAPKAAPKPNKPAPKAARVRQQAVTTLLSLRRSR